jgi:hypothetical protein
MDAQKGLAIMGVFSDAMRKFVVWGKGQIVLGYDAAEWRLDSLGSWMRFSEYGRTTTFGWEIDHIDPNGPDDLWNLQPLWWVNNRRKSDKPPFAPWLAPGGLAGPIGKK